MSGLTIALIIGAVLLVLGAGSCLVCVGFAATVAETEAPATPVPAATTVVPAVTATAAPVPTVTSTVAPKPAPKPPVRAARRTVDFVCPPGQTPGGVVRAGCLCGSEILGSACGAPGAFSDVTPTATGCRFVCD